MIQFVVINEIEIYCASSNNKMICKKDNTFNIGITVSVMGLSTSRSTSTS